VSEMESPGKVRLDKWLWAARFFKTRALSVEAIDGGRVKVNGERVKRAKIVQAGDNLQIRLGPYEHIVMVRAVSERRGPAKEAALLFEETPESIAEREKVGFQLKAAHVLFVPETNERPTKRNRRKLEDFRKKGGWGG
jgi:ribosome-associated heat shock protein Hsp15